MRATTLVEVVVALALGVLLVTGVQTLVVRSHQTARALETENADRERDRLPLELVRQDAAALPVTGSLELREGTLRMTTLCDLEAASERIRHAVDVRYHSVRESDGLALRRAQRDVGLDVPWSNGVAIAKGLQAVRFEIFDGQRWETSWPPSTPRATRAMRIALTWAGEKKSEHVIALGPLHWRGHDE
jgi:hypothetical protein